MTTYAELIEGARLVDRIDSTITTGDASYDGTALEISDETGQELFHIVVDSHGERQLLLFRSEGNIRLPLLLLQQIFEAANEKVRQVPL